MATATSGYTLFDDFVTEILQYCHGAPTILVKTHVKNAIVEFCERSMILVKDPASFCLDEDEHTYTFKYPNDRYRAVSIKGDVRLGEGDNHQVIRVTTEHELDSWKSKWRTVKGSTPTACYLTPEINKIRFYPIPNADSDDDIYMSTPVTLRRGQIEIDEWIWEKYEDTIQAGALSAILAIPGASWFNGELSNAMSNSWKRGIKRARAIALRGTGELSGRVKPQSFEVMGSDNTAAGGGYQWE